MGEELYTMESLAEDIERGFLKRNNQIKSWEGSLGKYVVFVIGDTQEFSNSLYSYCKTRVYMRVKKLSFFSHAIPNLTVVMFELL